MKARSKGLWKVLLALPLASAYALESCTADTIRNVADGLNDQADEIDGDDDVDLGEWLADEIEDW